MILKETFVLNSVDADSYPLESNSFLFKLKLPNNIPSTFHYNQDKHSRARISYDIWAGLMNKRKKKYFYGTKEIIIHSKYNPKSEVKT